MPNPMISKSNVCKKKNLTNTRSSGADEALRLTPKKELSLEQALDYIDTDELLEVTPENAPDPQENLRRHRALPCQKKCCQCSQKQIGSKKGSRYL